MISAAQQQSWFEGQQLTNPEGITTSPLPFIGRGSEAWRFTPVDSIFKHHYQPLPELQGPFTSPAALSGEECYRIVLVNGRYNPKYNLDLVLPDGLEITSLTNLAASPPFGRDIESKLHLFNRLNISESTYGFGLEILPEATIDLPIEVTHLIDGVEQASSLHPKVRVIAGKGSQFTLVEHYISNSEHPLLHNLLTEITLKPEAKMSHISLQQEGESCHHLNSLFLRQQRGSRYRGNHQILGSGWSRNDIHVDLEQEQASCKIDGLFSVGDGQHHDIRLYQRHYAPSCTSETIFKGLLHGSGRGVFNGEILVAPDAQGSDAHLNNANLLLDEDAIINSKPSLEIYADDVKCSHGSSIGQLEPEQLFYLQSRGIDADTGRRMLCHGFAAEVIEGIHVDGVREYLSNYLSHILAPKKEGKEP